MLSPELNLLTGNSREEQLRARRRIFWLCFKKGKVRLDTRDYFGS